MASGGTNLAAFSIDISLCIMCAPQFHFTRSERRLPALARAFLCRFGKLSVLPFNQSSGMLCRKLGMAAMVQCTAGFGSFWLSHTVVKPSAWAGIRLRSESSIRMHSRASFAPASARAYW